MGKIFWVEFQRSPLISKVPFEITSTQVAADRGALRIWRRVSLPQGGQKFCLQWQLAGTAWLPCARIAATRSAAERTSNTQSHSLQRSHPHLNSIFANKLHAQAPLHWVICIRLIRWHGAHLQAVVIVMEILLPDPDKLPSFFIFVVEKLEDVTYYLSWCLAMWLHMQVIWIFIITFLAFLQECPILSKNKTKQNKTNLTKQKRELNSNMYNGFKLSKKNPHQFNVVLIWLLRSSK